MRYLGHTIFSGKVARCDFHSSKINFFAATNGILGKIDINSQLNVTPSILFSKRVCLS